MQSTHPEKPRKTISTLDFLVEENMEVLSLQTSSPILTFHVVIRVAMFPFLGKKMILTETHFEQPVFWYVQWKEASLFSQQIEPSISFMPGTVGDAEKPKRNVCIKPNTKNFSSIVSLEF